MQNRMKTNKILVIALVLTMILSLAIGLVACNFNFGGNGGDEQTAVTYDNIIFKDGSETLTPDGHPAPSNYVPKKEGYTFRYWITVQGDKNSVFDQNTYDGSPITLYAYWKVKEYVVKFVDYDGTVLKVDGKDEQKVEFGKAAKAPNKPEREGYDFVGWDVAFDSIKAETKVTAQYEIANTMVSFYYGNILLTQKEMKVGEKINSCEKDAVNALSDYTSSGLEIEGWYSDSQFKNKITLSQATATKDMTVYAKLAVSHLKKITLQSSSADNTFEYSNDLSVQISCVYTTQDYISYQAEWFVDNQKIAATSDKSVVLSGLSVGSHEVKVVIKSSYEDLFVEDAKTINITVTKAALRVKVNDAQTTYGESIPNLTYTVVGGENVLLGNASFDCDYILGSPVGTYAIKIKNLESETYKLIFEDGVLTVKPKTVEVTTKNMTVIYGSDIPEYEYECTGLFGDDSLGEGVFECSYQKGSSAGAEYVIALSGLDNPNYNIKYSTFGKLTVQKMELAFRIEYKNVYYGDPCPTFTYKIIKGELLQGDSLGTARFTCEYAAGKDAGKYAIRMTGLKNANYEIQSTTTSWLNVSPKKVELTWDYGTEYIYNGSDQSATVSAKYLDINGEEQSANISFGEAGQQFKNAGTYTVTAEIDNKNYSLASNVLTLSIAKIDAEVVLQDKQITYGDPIPEYTYTATGMINGDNLGTMVYLCDYKQGSNAGEYQLKGSGLSNENYNITYKNARLYVLKRDVNVEWVYSDSPYIYSGKVQEDTIYAKYVKFDGRNTNMAKTFYLNDAIADFKVAGTYSIVASAEDVNYNFLNNTIQITMNPKEVFITVGDNVVTYGDPIPHYYYSVDGLVEGDAPSKLGTINYDCCYAVGTDVGEYAIEANSLVNPNYDIKYNFGKITVNKLAVTAEWDYLDAYTYDGSMQDATVTAKFLQYDGEYANMDIAFACQEYANFYHAGTYSVVATSTQQKNYQIADTTRTLVMQRKDVNIVANDFAVIYGDAVPSYTHNIIGLVDGDELGTLNYTCQYAKGSEVNQYEIAIDGYHNDDYNIIYTNATLTCNHKYVTVSWSYSNSYTYNRLDQSSTVSAVFNNYDGEVENATISYSCGTDSVFKNAGTYSLTASFANKNYVLQQNTNTLTINPKAVTVNVANSTATFGDQSVTFTKTVDGIVDGDSIEMTYDFAYVQGSTNAGSYNVGVNFTPNSNYAVTVNKGVLTVNKRPTSVQWVIGSYTYNGADQSASIYAKYTLYNGEQARLNVSVSGAGTVFKNVGTYSLTAVESDSNYSYSNTTSSASIQKKTLNIQVNPKTIEFGNTATFDFTQSGLISGDSLGSYSFSCTYTVGSPVGKYDIILQNASNPNYDINVTNSKLTVNARNVQVDWKKNDSYVYTGSDQSSTIECSYTSYDGKKVIANAALSGSTQFKNAGNYTFIAQTSDANYNLTGNTSISVTIDKARYTNISHQGLTGTYNPSKTLSNYTLSPNYAWINSTQVPVCKTTSYAAKYNADSTNYYDFELNIELKLAKANYTSAPEHRALTGTYSPNKTLADYTLSTAYRWVTSTINPTCNVNSYNAYYCADPDNYNEFTTTVKLNLTKATVSVSSSTTTFTFDYDGSAKQPNPTIMYNGSELASSNYSLVYSNGSSFTNGGVYSTFLTISSQNYNLPSTELTVNIRSVVTKSNTNALMTIDYALANISSGTIIVKYNTVLNSDATLKANTTLLVPYDSTFDDTLGKTVSDSAAAPSSANVTLTIASYVTLTVNGTVNVAGRQCANNGGAGGNTRGYYGCVNMQSNSEMQFNNGSRLYAFGFVIGQGNVILESGAYAYEPLQIKDYDGGTVSYSVYKEFFPFTQFIVSNIEVLTTIKYGAKLFAKYYIIASDKDFIDTICMFGAGGLFEITSSNGYITKRLDTSTGRLKVAAYNNVKTNNITINIKVSLISVDMETKGKEIPICGYYDISIEKGTTTISSRFKLLPGATFTVKQGATCTVTKDGAIIGCDQQLSYIYDGGKADKAYGGSVSQIYTRPNRVAYNNNSPVVIRVDGTLNVSGTFGGTVTTSVVGSTLNLSSADSIQGNIIYYITLKNKGLATYSYYSNNYEYKPISNEQTLGRSTYTGNASGYFA